MYDIRKNVETQDGRDTEEYEVYDKIRDAQRSITYNDYYDRYADAKYMDMNCRKKV